jgi:hypothetical protein
MNLKRTLGVVASLVLAGSGLVVLQRPAWAAPFALPTTCTIRTYNTNNYLTAVGGGGRTYDVIHSDATVAKAWERFTVVDAGDGIHVGIKTVNRHYLTAVGGGGRTYDVIHSDATKLLGWEKFTIIRLYGGLGYAIRTFNGHYLTAVGGGGRITDVIHSDATRVLAWERFRFTCRR